MGKIRSLYVRPVQSCDLCFSVSGILQERTKSLGDWVEAFDFQFSVISRLTVGATSDTIRDLAGSDALASLRSAAAASALDQRVIGRQVSYLKLYKNQTVIVDAYNAVYQGPDSKLGRIARLMDTERDRYSKVANQLNGYLHPGQGDPTPPLTFNRDGILISANTSSIAYDKVERSRKGLLAVALRRKRILPFHSKM